MEFKQTLIRSSRSYLQGFRDVNVSGGICVSVFMLLLAIFIIWTSYSLVRMPRDGGLYSHIPINVGNIITKISNINFSGSWTDSQFDLTEKLN